MRVLVVEDEVKMAALIRRGLREEGHSADVAIKGEDAIWMARGRRAAGCALSEPWIDGLTLQGKHGECALVHSPQRLATNEALESFDSQCELA